MYIKRKRIKTNFQTKQLNIIHLVGSLKQMQILLEKISLGNRLDLPESDQPKIWMLNRYFIHEFIELNFIYFILINN
jgi:hypothetical protein